MFKKFHGERALTVAAVSRTIFEYFTQHPPKREEKEAHFSLPDMSGITVTVADQMRLTYVPLRLPYGGKSVIILKVYYTHYETP